MKFFTSFSTLLISMLFMQSAVYADNAPEAATKNFTTVACNGFEYCESFGNIASSEWIESFQFGAIDNVTGTDGGYADYTSFSTDVIPGNTYDIFCEPGLTASWTEYFSVWIDFNQDGELDNDTELVFQPDGGSDPVMGTVTIPLGAIPGSTLMRVAMKFASVSTPCEAGFTFGEVEDYCVNIINPDFCYNPYVQILDIGEESAFLDWNEVMIAQGYDLRYRELGTFIWTDIYTTEDSLTLTDLEDCTEYEFQLRTDCDTTMTDYSTSYVFSTFGCGACIDYEYCESLSNGSFFEYINRVAINDLDNTSGDNMGYADFGSDFTTVLNNDSTYILTLEPFYTFFEYNVYWMVWIDYNQDGDFDDANELIYDSGTTADLLLESPVTIPSDAGIGLTKMRVSMQEFGFQQGPCDVFFNGEVEDYCVTVQPIVLPCITPEHLDTSAVSTFSTTMHWEVDEYEIGVGYVVRYKPVSETEWKEVSAVELYHTAYDLWQCTDYEFQVRTVCPQDLSDYSESFFWKSACLTDVEEPFVPTADIANVLVYPNPFDDQLSINVYLQKAGDLNIQVYDLKGQLIHQQSHDQLNTGEHQFQFNNQEQLATGMYFLRIATENSVITRKVVKQ